MTNLIPVGTKNNVNNISVSKFVVKQFSKLNSCCEVSKGKIMKFKDDPTESYHGQMKYSTSTGMNVLLTNQIGNTTVNFRKSNDLSIEGVTRLDNGEVHIQVSR